MGKDVLEIEPAATLTDTAGPKARSGAVGGSGVEGRADEGDVVLHVVGSEAGRVGDTAEGADAGEDGVGLRGCE